MNRTDRNRLGAGPWIGLALAIACALGFALAWVRADREADALRAWQATMLRHIQAARGGDTPLDPGQAFDALDRIVAMPTGADGTAPILPAGQAAAPAAPAPDADSSTEITRLRRTRSTGTAAGDAQIIERDSRAAWTGWK